VGSDGPKELCVRWGPDPPWEGAICGEMGGPIVKYRDTAVTCAKTAEPIVIPFGLLARSGSRNHGLDKGPDPTPLEGAILGERVAHCKV